MISECRLYLAELLLRVVVIIAPKDYIGYRLLYKLDEYASEALK